jgi:hypothetical protein
MSRCTKTSSAPASTIISAGANSVRRLHRVLRLDIEPNLRDKS